MEDQTQNWVTGAALLRPQGRRGEILADPHADVSIFTPGMTVWLAAAERIAPPDGSERVLESAWQPTGRNAGRLVLKLRGVDTISDAEAIAGKFLLLRTADLPSLPPDTFRVRDLVGCTLFNGNQLAGTVVDVQFPIAADGRTRLEDAPDLLAIQPASQPAPAAISVDHEAAEPTLIPFVRAWLVEVDIPGKRIAMNLPPGLFDDSDTLEEPGA